MTDVIIVDSGVANLASITSAFQRLGARVAVTGESAAVRDAPRMVLPGGPVRGYAGFRPG